MLQNMIRDNDTPETTNLIRRLRHSGQIREDVSRLEAAKREYARIRKSKPEQFKDICRARCSFLFNNYTNIFNRIVNDELNLAILHKFLVVLEKIENEEIDQHEGSYMIGMLLKELYIDAAIKGDKDDDDKKPKKLKGKSISWAEYKRST
jgi:hypothetical protein